tara:strand:+ start:1040 stop:1321 length:282 start_codon:yes stop_codon:yes gene_type:complete
MSSINGHKPIQPWGPIFLGEKIMFASTNDLFTVTDERNTVVVLFDTARDIVVDDTTTHEFCAGNGNDTIANDDMEGLMAALNDCKSFDRQLAA